MAKFGYVNPIPRALAHYERELNETATRVGEHLVRRDFPSIEGHQTLPGRVSALARSLVAPRRLNVDDVTISLWPTLGLFESTVWRSAPTNSLIVVHDPIPLRPQVGFDRISKFIARSRLGERATLVSHSREATDALRRLSPRNRVVTVDHPILDAQRTSKKRPGRVVVAGQYKPTRDVDLLRRLGPALQKRGYDPQIVGTGWPEIPGWHLDSRFVLEAELDEMLATAEVVFLPYRRYFQSGISLRALEQGTLTIGPRTSFAESVFGHDSDLIVDDWTEPVAWIEAIEHAATVSVQDTFDRYKAQSNSSWDALFRLVADGTMATEAQDTAKDGK